MPDMKVLVVVCISLWACISAETPIKFQSKAATDMGLLGENFNEMINTLVERLDKQEKQIDDMKQVVAPQTDINSRLEMELGRYKQEILDLNMEMDRKDKQIDNFQIKIVEMVASLEKRTAELESRTETLVSTHDVANSEQTSNGQNDNKDDKLIKEKKAADENKSPSERHISPKIRTAEHVAFSVYLDHDLTNIGIGQTLKYNQILINNGNGYNKFSGVFTVPMSGTYFFTFTIHTHHGWANMRLMADGQNVVGAVVNAWDKSESAGVEMASNSAIISLDVGQSVWVEHFSDLNGTLVSRSDYREVTFSGFLLCC